MLDIFIFFLTSLFTLSILAWAFSAYLELWSYRNLKQTLKVISRLLGVRDRFPTADPPDYIIAEGSYKGRRVVCRLSRFAPTKFFYYDLRLHIYMEPALSKKSNLPKPGALTENTRLEADNRITYQFTSLTSIKSFFFSSMISAQEFIDIFEELRRAAEILESDSDAR
jgi:hypothetical protein